MARVPAEELERLKREVSVERLAEARGVNLVKKGKDLHGLCPFHDDKDPSLIISPSKNLWNCLGACQAGGTSIDWVMKAEGVSFRHAVELLREGMPVPAKRLARKLPAPVDFAADDRALMRQVIAYYHQTLLDSPEALDYLRLRGIDNEEAIRSFQLGFANRTLGLRLPQASRKAGQEIRGRLQKLGIIRKSGHEHLNGSLVIPVVDLEGDVVEVYGRKISYMLRKGTALHLYLPGPHTGVWNLPTLAASKEVILCESLIDALTFWCAGFRNVTAAYGVNGFTREHYEALLAYGIERVLIAYDRDDAGDKAAAKLAERLVKDGIGCWRVVFPRGMDANEYAEKVTPAAKSLDLLLRKAVWMGEGDAPEVSAAVAHTTVVGVVEPVEDAAAKDEEAARPEPPSPEPAPLACFAAASESRPDAPASVLPAAPRLRVPMKVREHEVLIDLGDRHYRVRGMSKNLSYDVLRVNLFAGRGEAYHVDTLDLYSAPKRASFVKQAALELGVEPRVVKRDLGRVLLELEQLQDAQIQRALEPKEQKPTMSSAEEQAALGLLRDPGLLERIVADFARCGVVGEETNKLTGYLAAVSRKLHRPLAVIVQSSSAAGKSSLMDAVLAFVPEEERVSYSAMTGQSLFYMGETNLKHKVLAVAEEEGAERASYALKLLQSEGELTIASTGKDPSTGKHITHEYRVEGPVAIMLTTTAIDVDEELLNRCLVLSVDEARSQTRAIHAAQRTRRTLEGLLAGRDREAVVKLHRNAQRLLRPLSVVNPFASQLTFVDTQTRSRRDHEKYLGLIDTIALLHQHQRKVKRVEHQGKELRYIEVAPSDIEAANGLAHEVLGRTLDELPPQTRRLLLRLDGLVAEACDEQGLERVDFRFTRRWVRERTGFGNSQLKVHLARLVDMEYLGLCHSSHAQRHVYELLWAGEGAAGERFVPGLLDPETLVYDQNRPGSKANRPGSKKNRPGAGRPPAGPRPGSGNRGQAADSAGTSTETGRGSRKHSTGGLEGASSYVGGGPAAVAAAEAP